MTKDVIITLFGLQFLPGDDDPEPVEVVIPGKYYKKNNSHYVLYDEITEGFKEPTRNTIKFSETSMMVKKHGLLNVDMFFEKGKKTFADYRLPMGSLQLEIGATAFSLKETEELIEYRVDYGMRMEDSLAADCMISLKICAAENGGFSLNS